MGWIIAGTVALVALLALFHGLQSAQPKTLARIAKWIGIGAAVALAGYLLVRSASLAGLLPLALAGLFYWRQAGALRNSMRWRSGGQAGARSSAGQTSDVETPFLRMSLDHDSGETTGTVLQGRYAGARLHELGFDELMAVLAEARVTDPQGAQLLEAYVSRVHPDAWERAGGSDAGDHGAAASPSGRMSRQQALDVLGLKDGANEDDIREAHRRLMRQVHPDRGGSDFLAAQINAARDVLLGV